MAQQQSTASPPEAAQRRIPKQPECNIGTSGHVDHGKCVAWSTYVLLDGVPMTGEEILNRAKRRGVLMSKTDGEEVYAFEGNHVVSINESFEAVGAESSLFVQQYSGPMYVIRGGTGRELRVTPEHPLLINRGGIVQWIKARDIREGDYAGFLRRVPMREDFRVPENVDSLRYKYSVVTAEDSQSIEAKTSGFADYTALSTQEVEKLRILARLTRGELCRLAHIDSAEYARNVREGRAHTSLGRERLVEVLRRTKVKGLASSEFLAEQKLSTGKRIRLLRKVSLDEDLAKWFAFVWSEGSSTEGSITVTQTIQEAMLLEYLRITRERFGLEVKAHARGVYSIYNSAFVDYIRATLGYLPGNESTCGIADWVCELPQGLKAVFLRWFFTLDGEFNRGQISITQLNERNTTIIGYLLHSFGIVPRFSVRTSPTKKGRKEYSRVTVSGRNDLKIFASLIGFEDPRVQNELTQYLSTIEKENKQNDLSIPVDAESLVSLLRGVGITREGFGRAPGSLIAKEANWYHAYEDAVRKGRISRQKLLLIIRATDEHLSRVERSLATLTLEGPSLRAHASLIGLSLESLAARAGTTRKRLTRLLRVGQPEQLPKFALHLEGETESLLRRASGTLDQLRRLASSSMEYDRIVRVSAEPYNGMVFDLSVPGLANFIAGKGATICHNTSLVQAITGVWASAHSEELKRGITIKVGYADAAFYKCPVTPPPEAYSTSPACPVCGSETKLLRAVSFVDAPGHESLMTNMLAGAALMDGVMLVIAANEPVPMPQTREHLLALQMLGMKKMVVVQNKIDRVDIDGARKNYEAIRQFLANTVGADAPIIPVSAQNRINIDVLIESLEETIPTPKHDFGASPQMYILRSFDVNRPGADVKSLVGGVLGGSLVRGELRVGDEIEILPGLAEEKSGKYSPIATKVSSLGTGAGMTDRVGPGGLIALGTALDPRLTKGDVLVGNMIGKSGGLPPTRTHITLDLQLFDQAVGSASLVKVDKVRATETLRLNVGTASTLGTVTSARESVAELDLKKPVVADDNARAAISRRIAERWRLIGSGLVR